MRPITQDLVVLKGATFSAKLQWCAADAVHKVISAVNIGLPTVVTAVGHGLTDRSPVWITNVRGPRDLNTDGYRDSPARSASVIDVDTLAIDFDSGSLPAYQSGGVLTYYPTVDLTGYTAKMQVRASAAAPDVLLELSTQNGGILITPETGTIERRIAAAQSAALAFVQGIYDLELVAPDGFTTRLVQGTFTTVPEVTRDT